jgi:hypothetical protein
VPVGAFEGVRTPITVDEVLNVIRVQPSNRPILAVGWAAVFLVSALAITSSVNVPSRDGDHISNDSSRRLLPEVPLCST